jgi:hypothetical protein
VPINPIIRSKTRYFFHAYAPALYIFVLGVRNAGSSWKVATIEIKVLDEDGDNPE